ncbi:MAG: SagB/ThcOx family dehydrogenase, partial [Planctomycetota bacterium]
MEPWQIALEYHERTKHHFNRYARSLGYLDWATQPDPFRRYHGAPLVPLRFSENEPAPSYDDLFVPGAVQCQPVTLTTISEFFEFSLALSAWKQYQGSRWALRINPSSGNLHPTEGYLVIGPVDGLGDTPGVYHYAPKEHALERRTEFSGRAWDALIEGFPRGTFLAGLTSIHWRQAWKYGERAYRYCQHDAGHALAALTVSAAVHGWNVYLLPTWSDADIAALLGLERAADFTDAEREQPDLLVAVVPSPSAGVVHPAATLEALADIARGSWSGRANRLSKDHMTWELIDAVADACSKPTTPTPELRAVDAFGPPLASDRRPASART